MVAGSEAFQVRRCIVCPRSVFFAATCDGKSREASSGVINIQENPALVRIMIEFLCTMQYTVTVHEPEVHNDDYIAETAPINGMSPGDPEVEELASQIPHKNKGESHQNGNNKNKNKRRHKRKSNNNDDLLYSSATDNSSFDDKSAGSSTSSDYNANWDPISLHIMMYALGERLLIDGLKRDAK
ncbi:hypothetical protein EMCG_07895 [[Emmonsia] crescens]|uniref:BTB domain-containing protein n=1 Tax=[Emmonsia] crescens TaxID=73230 RepID=A0A0G2JAV5_9EURO|nr:hypothetical protein EMCG_07895 [Emmonsia crescens UAMH 3008]